MKLTMRKSLILLAVAAVIVLPDPARSEDGFPQVRFRGSFLDPSNCPYDKAFVIVGGIPVLSKPVSVVSLDIVRIEGNTRTSVEAKPLPWIAKAPEDAEFRIVVPPLKELKGNYEFTFVFFTKVPTDSVLISNLKGDIIRSIQSLSITNENDFRRSDALAVFNQCLATRLGSPQSTNVVFLLGSLYEDSRELDDLIDEIVGNALVREDIKKPGLAQQDIAKKKQYIDSTNTLINDKLVSYLKDQYLPVANYSLRAQSRRAKAEIDRLGLGTVFGFGNVFLGTLSNSPKESELAAFTGLKIRFGWLFPGVALVDPSLDDPFPDKASHFYVVFGSLISTDLTYQGRNLVKVSGYYPVIALGYDINPHLGVSAGVVLFKQQSLNPLASSRNEEKGAFWLSVDLDADLFNALKGALK